MSGRPGVLSRLRSSVRRGKGGKTTLTYVEIILKDPCVYCGKSGCDTVDHITPVYRRDKLNTGNGINHWTNLAPAHTGCNVRKGSRGVFFNLLGI